MPRGLKPIRKRLADGSVRIYWYHRATGKRLQHEPTTAEGFLEAARLDGLVKTAAAVTAPPSGSYAALWLEYRASPSWRALRPRTRSDYQAVRDWLGDAADATLRSFTRGAIVGLRDKATMERGRRFGNYVVQVLRLTFGWALEREKIPINPASGVKMVPRPANAPNVNRAWTPLEIAAYMAEAPHHLQVPVAIALCVGLRQGDALRLTWAAYAGDEIIWTHSKNAEPIRVPVDGLLEFVLADAATSRADIGPIAVNSAGEAWSQSGFRASFFKLIRKLERAGKLAPGCTFHGLRHTIGAIARDANESESRVAAAVGDRSPAMAATYGRDADSARARSEILGAIQQQFANIERKPRTQVSNRAKLAPAK